MGGHGGLNILPQKRWNVYNFDNREKVKKDEEEAARDEQLKREQAQKRDSELRLERLRTSRGLAPLKSATEEIEIEKETVKEREKEKEKEKVKKEVSEEPVDTEAKTGGHINLFEGIKIFDPIETPKKERHVERDDPKRKRMKKEEPRVVAPEDEKYRLGYGVAGKGVKLPWYLEKRGDGEKEVDVGSPRGRRDEGKRKSGKKTLQELREERLKREKKEKERERQLIVEKTRKAGGFSRRIDDRFTIEDRFTRR